MRKITDELIRDIAGDTSTLIRGKKYFSNKNVLKLDYDQKLNRFHAIVAGTRNYEVSVHFDKDENYNRAFCTCPAFDEYWGECKHIVATLLEIRKRDQQGQFKIQAEIETIKEMMDLIYYKNINKRRTVEIEITYEFEPYYNIDNTSSFSMRIGERRLYTVRSPKDLINSIENNEPLEFGKEFTFDPEIHCFKEEDQPIMDLLKEFYEHEQLIHENTYGLKSKSVFKGKKVYLPTTSLKRFFKVLQVRSFHGLIMNRNYKDIKILEKAIPLEFGVKKELENLILETKNFQHFIPLTPDGEYFFFEGNVYKVPESQSQYYIPLYKIVSNQGNNAIKIPKELRERFISEIYPVMKRIGLTKIDEALQSDIYSPSLETEVYFDMLENKLTVAITFIYGDFSIHPFGKSTTVNKEEKRILVRDYEKEQQVIKIIEDGGFKIKNYQVYLDDEGQIFDFIYNNLQQLQEVSTVFYSEAFKQIELKDRTALSGGLRFTSKLDTLEFDFHIEGIDDNEIMDVFNSLKEKKKYYRLKDGSFLPLNVSELSQIQMMMDGLDLGKGSFINGIATLPRYRALFIDEYLNDINLKTIRRSREVKEFVENIRDSRDIEYRIPVKLDQVLREYQKTGFNWLKALSTYGLGGILADDMGLGKTLQVLTFLLSEKDEKGSYPSLIVAPTSLVYNWANEIQKFTPDLKMLVVSGNKNERIEILESIWDYDVVITSYPLIRRDADLYDSIKFRYCILDEAQHIKNPGSQNAKTVKAIKADNYFAMTGTPIENTLTELWSIFDFIMPGYLLSHGKFQKKFEKPIVSDNDRQMLLTLGKHIRPFILRRLKKDVLKELPAKLENTIVAELTKEQKKIYLGYLKQIKGELEQEIKEKGFQKSHIKILSGLTRLRQICCHPSMFIDDYSGGSGKIELLEEIIQDALDGGHRILLFSQFTSMLEIIKAKLMNMGIAFKYLDGSTEMKTRGVLVNQFNEGDGQVFLISLKAGGTGLNLTGADTVIHFDPWWNPAVEDQATDRAYRIGQQNTVHVMKFITQGTIEEKILVLQERKRQLINSVIEPGETIVSKLSEDEIKELFDI